jgi:hypothetical protein
MSSLIFGSVGSIDIFGGGPLPPDLGGYPEETIEPTPRSPETVRALATRIASLLFAAGVPGSMVAVSEIHSEPGMRVVVLGRRLDQIPASVLRLVGADIGGATVGVEVRNLTEEEVKEFQGRKERPQYGALTIPAVRFTIRRISAEYGRDRC